MLRPLTENILDNRMNKEIRTIHFSDILEIPLRNGLTKPKSVRGAGQKMINMGELFAYNRIYDVPMSRVPVTEKEFATSQVKKLDLLFARQSLVLSGAGKCSIILHCNEETVFESHIIRARIDKRKADPLFYYYYFNSHDGKANILSIVEQTAAAGIRGRDLSNLKIPYPSLNDQYEISRILSSFDDKIELNNKINDNLVDQIQAIYLDEFDPITHIPSGVLGDICHYSSDRISVSDLSVSTYYSTENMQPNKAGAVNATTLPSITKTTKCHKGDVLISNIRPYFKKIVYVTDTNCGCSTDVLCFVPNEASYSTFLFGTLYMDRFFDYMIAGSKGTKMPRGDKQQIMNYPVVIPSKELLIAFNEIVIPMLEQIASNRAENNTLSAMRDTLMSKLIYGELDVSGLDF